MGIIARNKVIQLLVISCLLLDQAPELPYCSVVLHEKTKASSLTRSQPNLVNGETVHLSN